MNDTPSDGDANAPIADATLSPAPRLAAERSLTWDQQKWMASQTVGSFSVVLVTLWRRWQGSTRGHQDGDHAHHPRQPIDLLTREQQNPFVMALVIRRVDRRRLAIRDNPLDPDALPGKQVREFLVLRPDRKIFKNIGQHASPGRTAKMRPRAAGIQVGGRRATLMSLTTGGNFYEATKVVSLPLEGGHQNI